jgi:hypothetical protein
VGTGRGECHCGPALDHTGVAGAHRAHAPARRPRSRCRASPRRRSPATHRPARCPALPSQTPAATPRDGANKRRRPSLVARITRQAQGVSPLPSGSDRHWPVRNVRRCLPCFHDCTAHCSAWERARTHTHTRVCARAHTNTHKHTHSLTRTYARTDRHTHTHPRARMNSHARTRARMKNTRRLTRTHGVPAAECSPACRPPW